MLRTVWSLEDYFEGRKKKGCIKYKCAYVRLLANWPDGCDQKQEAFELFFLFVSEEKEEALLQ